MSNKREVLAEQDYWDSIYEDVKPEIVPPGNLLRTWIESHVPRANGDKHALEIGCFPGRYLGVLGELGYVIHGVDLTPGVRLMSKSFRDLGLRVGEFREADFLSMQVDQTYDLVSSYGFIEHFSDWPAILRKHAALVKPGGLLVVEVPNFRGAFQQLFHRWLDRTNMSRHNLEAMQPREWAKLLESQEFDVLWCGWIGTFMFWSEPEPFNLKIRIGEKLLRMLTPFLSRKREGTPSVAPYCGVIARRRQS